MLGRVVLTQRSSVVIVNDSAYTLSGCSSSRRDVRGVRTIDRRTRNPYRFKYPSIADFRYAVHTRAITLLIDWLQTFTEIPPDNHTKVAN